MSKPAHINIEIQISQIEDLNEDCVKISRPYLLYFLRNKSSKSVTVGFGPFIILNDSTSPKVVIRNYFNLIQYF